MLSKQERKEAEKAVIVGFWLITGLIGLMLLLGYLKDAGVLG